MRVIITGGTGLIGGLLAAKLAGNGHEVIVLSRKPAEHLEKLAAGVRAEGWDGKTAAGWGKLADGAGAVINLAGENLAGGPWTNERKAAILASRKQAGQAVVQAVEQSVHKPDVVIQASAIGYYGSYGDEVLTESSPAGSDFLSQVCVQWEASTAPVEAEGVRRVIIRTGLTLTRQGSVLPPFLIPFRLFVGGPLGSGRQWWSWIHMEDEINAICFLLEHSSASGPVNLTAPNPVTMRQFTRALGQALQRPSIFPVPALVLKAIFGQMSSLMLSSQRVLPSRLQALGYTFKYTEIEPALRSLV